MRRCRSRSIRAWRARSRPTKWFDPQSRRRWAPRLFGLRNLAHRHADSWRGLREAPIERAERRAMIGADRQMESVARAEIELRLVGEPRGRAKVFPRHRKGPKALGAKPGERRKRGGAMVRAESARPQLHRQRGSKLCRRPVADRQVGRVLSREPGL